MGEFRHHNNTFYINDNKFDIGVLNAFDPKYSLSEGLSRTYIQGKKHFISNGKCQMPAPFPWKEGDCYIKSIRELMYLKQQIEIDKTFE
tara:strand:+ start:14 stop:280 length:267 start_codon:yes stop_codon:yes gene_type:complete